MTHLWGFLKDRVYKNNQNTLEKLKTLTCAFQRLFKQIVTSNIHRINTSVIKVGGHFHL